MGAGASAGVSAACHAASVDDVRSFLNDLPPDAKSKLMAALDSLGGSAGAVPGEMKAWRAHAYGEGGDPADTIGKMTLDTVPVPKPANGQVLIKVEYAALNPIDWKLFSGGLDAVVPVTFPYTPGFDIAGTIASLGEGVSGLAAGDKVCADIGLTKSCVKDTKLGPAGGFAEYAIAEASTVSKVGSVPLESAVTIPLAGQTSYQSLFTGAAKSFAGTDLGKLKSGEKILILGGATLCGIFAIQLAKNAGAEVACTASTNSMPDGTTKLDFCKKLGADVVIDYKASDWSEELAGKDYDLIFDCAGTNEDWPKASKVLKKGCSFVSIANFTNPESTADHSFKVFLKSSSAEDNDALLKLASEGKLTMPVDSVVKFEEVPAAITKSMKFAAAGKIVVKVSS